MDDDEAIEHPRPMTTSRRGEKPEAEAKDAGIPEALLKEFDPEVEQDGQDSGLDDQHLEVANLLSRWS